MKTMSLMLLQIKEEKEKGTEKEKENWQLMKNNEKLSSLCVCLSIPLSVAQRKSLSSSRKTIKSLAEKDII